MNITSFNKFSSTFYVNKRRKEAIIQPLQTIIEDNIQQQLDLIQNNLLRIKNHSQEVTLASSTSPDLQNLTAESFLREQERNLLEIKAQIIRSIEVVLADTEDVDPTSSQWSCLANYQNYSGSNLITAPSIYLPLSFYRTQDSQGRPRSIPVNPSEYLPSDKEYFRDSGCLDQPKYIVPSHHSYLQSHPTEKYNTSNADKNTNKFYCHLEPPPPTSTTSLSLPNSGDTYLRDGSPYFKKLAAQDTIYIPTRYEYGKAISWRNGTVIYNPIFYFSNPTNTFHLTDHWISVPASEPTKTIPFKHFVITIPSTHPSGRNLQAYVSPYTVADSDFLLNVSDL